jgi:hypothetical protein
MWEYDTRLGWIWLADYEVNSNEKDRYKVVTDPDGVIFVILTGAALQRQKLRTPSPGEPVPEVETVRLHNVSPFKTKM